MPASGISAVFLVLITILLPPAGVYIVSGCGADLIINIVLTLLGYIPGHIHAFYLEWRYYERREYAQAPVMGAGGGGYGTIDPNNRGL